MNQSDPRSLARRFSSSLALVAALLTSTAHATADERAEPLPNVILISIDTLRADHLGAYGYERLTSPALDRLAAEGARFTNAYSQAASTVPSHASLFTGRYPFQHGTFGYKTPLPKNEVTIAEYLAHHGYRRFGFASSVRFSETSGFRQGFEEFTQVKAPKQTRSADLLQRARLAIEREEDRPYFAFLHFFDPHEPYDPPEPLAKKWHAGIEGLAPSETSTYVQANRSLGTPVPADTLDYLRALYDAEILHLDQMLGEFFAWLAERNDERGTLIVLTSDHGEEFKEHQGLSHAHDLHEELLRVPLIFHWPGRIPAGTTITTPTQAIDIAPTLIELLALPALRKLPGRSLAKAVRGEKPRDQASGLNLVAAQQRPALWSIAADLPAGRYKLTVKHGEPTRLYRLDDDPGGLENLARRSPAEVRRLKALADELGLSNPEAPVTDAATIEVPPEILEQLRALGYAEEVDGPQAPAE